MNAAILSIGDELVLGEALDTNAPWLAGQLGAVGYRTTEHRTVGDDQAAIAAAIRELCASNDVLVITGGLGPTEDDLTRFAFNEVTGAREPMVTDALAVEQLKGWFAGRAGGMPERNLVQAKRPAASRFLANPRGTAMGLQAEHDGCMIFALPGPPGEMRPMVLELVLPALPRAEQPIVQVVELVHAYGIGESAAAERLGALLQRGQEPLVGITVTGGVVTARVRHLAPRPSAQPAVDEVANQIEALWEPYAFGRQEQTLAGAVGMLLLERGATLVTAESCSGGWLAGDIVTIDGCSEYFLGGWVTYANALKSSCLGVDAALIERGGAVSEPVACAMARGAVERGGGDYGLAITGVAGPGGGSAEKPVGTVVIALARRDRENVHTIARRYLFRGSRSDIRQRSARTALQMLRFDLLGVPEDTPLLGEVSNVVEGS